MRIQGRTRGRLFSVSMGTIPGRTTPGGACVVSKKAAKDASARNKIKRQVRHALVPLLSRLPSPLVIVCTAHREAVGTSFERIQLELAQLVQELSARFER